MKKVGLMCYREHEVFDEVIENLKESDIEAIYYSPEEIIPPEDLEELDAVFGKRSRNEVYETLFNAEKMGIETYNGFCTHLLSDMNPRSYEILTEGGYDVPKWSYENDLDGKVVKKPVSERMEAEPELKDGVRPEKGFFYQDFIPNSGIDYKLYGIDEGDKKEVFTVRTPSKMRFESDERKLIENDKKLERDVKEIMELFDNARGIGIDVIKADKDYFIDINAAPSFRDVPRAPESISKSIENMLKS